ncbi:MAG: MBL fold metallo-hydrolase [Lachnospiraceae bacterium]|nr:MBL fold metallo-hydrolase [Lachnospiraceae bacterium]
MGTAVNIADDKDRIGAFRMVGNLYFVGTYKASSHLIDTGDGLILLDTGYAETADVILESMDKLGFDIRDVKYIIHSHGHRDHTGGTAKLVALSGAKTFIHEADLRYLSNDPALSFVPDVFVRDGDIIRLGNTEILCLETPGHTAGTLSFFFDLEEKGRVYRAGTFGGAGTNQLKKPFLWDRGLSLLLRGQFLESIERLKKEHVDVFIGNHSWQNDTRGNYEKSLTCEENPFIDDTRWRAFLEKSEQKMLRIMREESRTQFINYAHRGASEYAPENTLLSFNLGVFMGANGIETDVHLTKDGVPVLFHDDTLKRVTGEEGSIEDYTYEELRKFRVVKGELADRIVKLEDFLEHMSFRDMLFAIELKAEGTAQPVADLVRAYHLEKKVVITSFKYEELCRMCEYAPELRKGYLAKTVTEELLADMRVRGIDEICPIAKSVTAEQVEQWHRQGFNVRAWGVKDEELMKQVYDAGADGMTVNFPDKLAAYICQCEASAE